MPCNGRFARLLLPLLLAAFLLLPSSLSGPAFAQSGQPPQQTAEDASGSPAGAAQSVAQTRQDAEALIRLLQDPGARGALIDYLQRAPAGAPTADPATSPEAPASPPAATTPSEASPAAAEGEVAPAAVERQPTHIALRIALATQNVLSEGMVYVERISRSFTSLPTALSYSAGANWDRVQSILLQLVIIALGMLVATGTSGPAGAMVANLTHFSVHGTAFATLTLANNLLGLAPGPYLTGVLADRLGLDHAFQLIPLISIAAALVFFYAKRHYHRDIARLAPLMAQGDPS